MSMNLKIKQNLLMILAMPFLSGCFGSSITYPTRSDGPPIINRVDLTKLPNPVVRREPKSKIGNKSPYKVFGKSYRVMESGSGYKATGIASWYGRKFHGRKTSNGETFDMFKLTAAHRSLPLPIYLRVTNLDNGRSTIVRVNDRGPFHGNRLIDLSYAGAVKLGFAEEGTARVRLQVLEKGTMYYLQVGAFRDRKSAQSLKKRAQDLTRLRGRVVSESSDRLYRVHLGPIARYDDAISFQELLMTSNYSKPLILDY